MQNTEDSDGKVEFMKENRKMKFLIIFIILLTILVGEQIYYEKVIKKSATYDAFVLTEKHTTNFKAEWFELQWGISADFVEKNYSSTSRFISILEKKIELYSNAAIICMQVPADIMDYPEFEEILNSNPLVTFYTYCTVEPASYWKELTNEEKKEIEERYNATSEMLMQHENVVHFELYNLEWIIGNTSNYLKDESFNETVSLAIFHSFTDHLNAYVEPSNLFSNGEITLEYPYIDKLKGKTAIVLGDSIWDIDRTSTGVEMVVEEMSGLQIENLAVGGAGAAYLESMPTSFTQITNDLLQLDMDSKPDYIFVEYGINDYFYQVMIENIDDFYDITTYKGALRTGIDKIKINFPEAEIILIGPTSILLYDEGRINISGEGSLRDYEHALEEISDEYEISLIYNYKIEDLNEKKIWGYLRADQVHFNEKGMFAYGKRIVDYLCKE